MSKITLAPNAAGTGTFTVAAPATSTDRTLTLPDVTATLAAIITGTTVASTSGANVDFTGLPSGIKRITVMFKGVSLTGATDDILVQIGNSGGFLTTGYTSTCQSGTSSASSSTSGFIIRVNSTTREVSGAMTINSMTGTSWVSTAMARIDGGGVSFGGGDVALTGTLDRIRVTQTGVSTFDAGTINIMYEG